MKWLWGAEYDHVVITVHDRVDYNYYGWKGLLKCGSAIRCFPYDTSEKILNCYVNLCLKREIPEYEYIPQPGSITMYPFKVNMPSQEDYVAWQKGYAIPFQRMCDIISDCSGAHSDLVRKHIEELYWATEDKSLPTGKLHLKPLTSLKYVKDGELPESAESLDKVLQMLSGGLGWAKWGLIGLLGVGALYFGSKIVEKVPARR